MTQLPAAVCFSGKSLSIIDRDGVPHLTAADLARALGYADERSVSRIYNRHSEEFTYQMTLTVNLTVKGFGSGNSDKPVRLFSPRGCHLVAMFARTSVAAAFRRWVLDVLEVLPSIRKTGGYVSNDTVSLTTAHRCGTVAGKELQNSENVAISALVSSRIFCARTFLRREAAAIQHPQGENCWPVYVPVLNLPTFSGRRFKTSPRDHISNVGDVL
ncbi:BRO-N domain-containing protein [Xylella fastidiosa]|uniref:BRO-N domain-containing protein n=1 Tax=Xylella fastidiosa TaxID=2371 RepID=UPI003CE8BC05